MHGVWLVIFCIKVGLQVILDVSCTCIILTICNRTQDNIPGVFNISQINNHYHLGLLIYIVSWSKSEFHIKHLKLYFKLTWAEGSSELFWSKFHVSSSLTFHIFIFFSRTTEQFQPNLAQSFLGWREFKIILIKYPPLSISRKLRNNENTFM